MTESGAVNTRFPAIEVSGSPHEMGRQLGEAMRDEIRDLMAIVVDRINEGPGGSTYTYEQGLEVASSSIAPAEAYAPHLVEELRGLAEAADVPLEKVMLVNVRNQIPFALRGGCTAVAVESKASASGAGVIGQNWDNDPAMEPFSVVLTRRPENAPAHVCFCQPGVIGYIGFNEAGIAVCLNTLVAPAAGRGVPWYFTVRSVYEESSLDGAVAQVNRAERAIPNNAAMLTPEGAADLEVAADAVHVLRGDDRGILVHTNHWLHPDAIAINDFFPELIQSRGRLERSQALLSEILGPVSVDDLKRLLSDHDGYPRSICRHANDDPGTGSWTSVVSVIMEPSEGRLHLTRGNPCESPYEVYRLD